MCFCSILVLYWHAVWDDIIWSIDLIVHHVPWIRQGCTIRVWSPMSFLLISLPKIMFHLDVIVYPLCCVFAFILGFLPLIVSATGDNLGYINRSNHGYSFTVAVLLVQFVLVLLLLLAIIQKLKKFSSIKENNCAQSSLSCSIYQSSSTAQPVQLHGCDHHVHLINVELYMYFTWIPCRNCILLNETNKIHFKMKPKSCHCSQADPMFPKGLSEWPWSKKRVPGFRVAVNGDDMWCHIGFVEKCLSLNFMTGRQEIAHVLG